MKYMFDLFSAEVFLLEKEKNDKQRTIIPLVEDYLQPYAKAR
jgi:hypothetical protein